MCFGFNFKGRKTRDATVERLRHHLRDTFIPLERRWMVLFPEGGFLRKRLEVSQRYAAKNNLPILTNVTLPRIGALKAIMEVLPPHASTGNNNAAKRNENGSLRSYNSQGNESFNDFLYYLYYLNGDDVTFVSFHI